MEKTEREKALKKLLYLLIANTVLIFGAILAISLTMPNGIMKTSLLVGIILYAFAGRFLFRKGLNNINEKYPVEQGSDL